MEFTHICARVGEYEPHIVGKPIAAAIVEMISECEAKLSTYVEEVAR